MMEEATTNSYQPQKNWKEISSAVKIERMRQYIKDLERRLAYGQQQIQELRTDFLEHEHSENKLMKPVRLNGLVGGLLSASKVANPKAEADGEVYF